MYLEYGPLYGMSILGDDELVICDPNLYDTILRREGKYPIGGAESATTFVEYYKETNNTMGMKSMSRGAEWKEWRGPIEKDMVAEWKDYLPDIAMTANKISKVAGYEVTESKNIEFVDFISRSAFDLFSCVMYGASPLTVDSTVAKEDDIEFVQVTQKAFDLTGQLLSNPLEKVFGGDIYKDFKVNMDQTFKFGYDKTGRYIEQVNNEKKNEQVVVEDGNEEASSSSSSSKCPVSAVKKHVPFVERLMNRGKLSIEDIQSSSGPLLMAGVDTTAYVMSWLFLNLALNPDKQTKLAAELKEVLNGDDLTMVDQMNSLPYLMACIRESHRLTPPTPLSAKKLNDDIDVVIDDNKAYHVKAGQRISLNLRAFPMDPHYVDNPTSYQPERFLLEAVQARKGTVSEVIDHPSFSDPFGRGKRRCLGSNIAIAEIRILAARLIQDYEITLVDPADAKKWKPKQKLMLKADPYPSMKLTPRKR